LFFYIAFSILGTWDLSEVPGKKAHEKATSINSSPIGLLSYLGHRPLQQFCLKQRFSLASLSKTYTGLCDLLKCGTATPPATSSAVGTKVILS